MKKLEIKMKSNFFEAPVGFEPTNKGFADLPLKPLGYSAIILNKLSSILALITNLPLSPDLSGVQRHYFNKT
jgi:hypothetical protein